MISLRNLKFLALSVLPAFVSSYSAYAININDIPSPNFAELEGAQVEDPDSIAILEQVFRSMIQSSLENPLAPQYRELIAKITDLESSYLQYQQDRQREIHIDESESPILFISIKSKAKELASEFKKLQKLETIYEAEPSYRNQNLNDEVVDALFIQFSKQKALLDKTNLVITSLIESAGNTTGYQGNELNVERRTVDTFYISANGNPFLGYAANELLHFSKEFKKFRSGIRNQEAEPVYHGQLDFPLSFEDLENLSLWVDEIRKWEADFSQILAVLVGESSIELGQKSKEELLKGALCTPEARAMLQTYPQDKVALLFNTMSVNLEHHPQRDILKNIIEDEFSRLNLTSRHGEKKTFLPGTYRANIGLGQLKILAPALNKIIMTKKLTEDVYGQNAFLNGLAQQGRPIGDQMEMDAPQVDSGLDFLKMFKLTELNSVLNTILNHSRSFKNESQNFEVTLAEQTSIETTERKSLDLFEKSLNDLSGVNFQPIQNNNAVRPISKEQIRDLYTAGGQTVQIEYPGGVFHKNIPALITSLRQSKPVLKMAETEADIDSVLAAFEKDVVTKLKTYSHMENGNGAYSRVLFDEGLDYLESLVSKIVYQEQSGVTQASIENALRQLAGIVGNELVRGCSMGFAGRMSQILSGLIVSVGNTLVDFVTQEKQKAYQLASQEIGRHTYHSSDGAASINPIMASVLGLSSARNNYNQFDTINQSTINRSELGKIALGIFVSKYNPIAIYHLTRQMLGDEFWRLNSEKDDEGMYRFLTSLGFGRSTVAEENRNELNREYRVNGNPQNRWQYAFFQQNLPSRLIQILFDTGVLYKKTTDYPGHIAIRGFQNGTEFAVAPVTPAQVAQRQAQQREEQQNREAEAARRRQGISYDLGYNPESDFQYVRPQSGG